MTDPQLHRDLGRVEGKLDAVSADVADIKRHIADLTARDHRHRGARHVITAGLSALVAFATAWYTK